MPTVNLTFTDQAYTSFIAAAPRTGVAHVTNNGNFSVYIRDVQTGIEGKVRPLTSLDIPVIKNNDYSINVCGDVSITYTIT